MKVQQIAFRTTTAADGSRRLEAELLDDVLLPAGSVLRLVLLGDRATVVVVAPKAEPIAQRASQAGP